MYLNQPEELHRQQEQLQELVVPELVLELQELEVVQLQPELELVQVLVLVLVEE